MLTSCPTLLDFPSEVLDMFWQYCSGTDVVNMACTSQRAYQAVQHLLWKHLNIPWEAIKKKKKKEDTSKKNDASSLLKQHGGRLHHTVSMVFHHKSGVGDKMVNHLKWGYVCKSFRKILKLSDPHKVESLSFVGVLDTRGMVYFTQRLRYLKHLSFKALKSTKPKGWHQVSELPHLQSLEIHTCPIDDEDVSYICTSHTLQQLKLHGCKLLTKKSVLNISKMQQLVTLRLSDNKSLSASLAHLSRLTNLKDLDVSGTLVRNKELVAIVGALCGTLENLALGGCVLVTDRVLTFLDRLERLQRLDVRGTVLDEKSLGEFCDVMGMDYREGIATFS